MMHNAAENGSETRVKLPEGTYFLRLTTLDSIGLESRSQLRGLIVSRSLGSASPGAGGSLFGAFWGSMRAAPFRWIEFLLLTLGISLYWSGAVFDRKALRRAGLGVIALGILLLVLL